MERLNVLVVAGLLMLLSINGIAGPASTPMAQVIELLDTGGGSRSGQSEKEGYFIVVVALSNQTDEYKAYELARLDALRQLNDSVNGTVISGHAQSSIHYDSETQGVRQTFSEVVNNQFKGSLSAARVLKKGNYDDQYFVAMVLAQNDVQRVNGLVTTEAENNFAGDGDATVKTVTAKGVSTMKSGIAKGRAQAIDNAIRNAVQQAKGVMVSGRSGTFNGMLSAALSTKTKGYVRSYDIIDENKRRGEYFVTIKALVDTGQLLRDVNFYLTAFNTPKFIIDSNDPQVISWLQPKLEGLGFKLTTNRTTASHAFVIEQHQSKAVSHGSQPGFKTRLVLTLTDIKSGDVLFTLSNNENKTIYRLAQQASAKKASILAAYKQLGKKMDKGIVTALAKIAQQGRVYPIIVVNANRTDLQLFKHTLENSASGTIERWEWDENNKQMTLYYRYVGPFTQAVDNFLPSLYQNYKTQGKGHRPKALLLAGDHATFRILK